MAESFARSSRCMRSSGDKRDLAQNLASLEKELKRRLDVHEAVIVTILQRVMDIIVLFSQLRHSVLSVECLFASTLQRFNECSAFWLLRSHLHFRVQNAKPLAALVVHPDTGAIVRAGKILSF